MNDVFTPEQQPEHHSNMKQVVTLVVLLVVLGLVVWFLLSLRGPAGPEEIVEETAEGVTRTTPAEEGAIVSSFPQELIPEPDVATIESYSLTYHDHNVNQPVVVYTSLFTYAENVKMFPAHFQTLGWATYNNEESEPGFTSMYFQKGPDDAHVTIRQHDDETISVSITYLSGVREVVDEPETAE